MPKILRRATLSAHCRQPCRVHAPGTGFGRHHHRRAGDAVISTQINIQHATDVTLQSVSRHAPIEHAGGTRNAIVRSTLLGPVRLSTTTDAQLVGTIVGDGIEIIGGVRTTIQRNTIVATGSGIRLTTLSASDLIIRQNKIIVARRQESPCVRQRRHDP